MASRFWTGVFLVVLANALPAGGSPVAISDDMGHTVRLSHPALRIVSLYAGHSENLKALGMDGALVAVTTQDDSLLFPHQVRLSSRPSVETILALSPDLVLWRPMQEEKGDTLRQILHEAGIAGAALAPPRWHTVESYLDRLGAFVGIPNGSRVWKALLQKTVITAPLPLAPTRFFLESSSRELRTCAPDSWAAHLLALAGGTNIAMDATPLHQDSPLAPYGVERLLAQASHGIDVYIVQTGPMNPVTPETVRQRPWMSALQGVAVVFFPEDRLSRPSLLRFESTVEELRKIFSSRDGSLTSR